MKSKEIILEDIFMNYQLDGIECYYATFTKEQSNFFRIIL